MRLTPDPHPDRAELLRLAHNALHHAASVPGRGIPSPALVEQLGMLAGLLGEIDTIVTVIHAELERRARADELVVTEGPFEGEPAEAVATTALWAAEARAATIATRRAIENAQIAASGLAETR